MAKGIDKKLDDAWSEKVKRNAGYKCEYCGTKEKRLNSHHDFTRSRNSTRWEEKNGTCLCVGCHTMSSIFSAHKTPRLYFRWLEKHKGKVNVDEMEKRSQQIKKFTKKEKEDLLDSLTSIE